MLNIEENIIDNSKRLVTVLSEWLKILNEYADCHKKDDEHELPHYHYELSNTGLFASAVWRAGGVALQEYDAKKKGKKGGTALDLYFAIKDGVGWDRYIVEFKYDSRINDRNSKWLAVKLKDNNLPTMKCNTEKLMDWAKDDVLNVEWDSAVKKEPVGNFV